MNKIKLFINLQIETLMKHNIFRKKDYVSLPESYSYYFYLKCMKNVLICIQSKLKI